MIKITRRNFPVGFFDSGLGGISVMAEAARLLSRESLIYYGDAVHAPYGMREAGEVKELSLRAAEFLMDKGIKMLVVACNTATSVAINELREKLSIPVIGMEPALKPAAELGREGKILVMATPVTLREEKFQKLLRFYQGQVNVVACPCPGLVDLIEQGEYQGRIVRDYLQQQLSDLNLAEISTVVLGCTHYVFVKKEIEKMVPQAVIVDGNLGTVKQLRRILEKENIISWQKPEERKIEIYTSGDAEKFISLASSLLNDDKR